MGKIMLVDPSLLDRKRMRIVLEAAGHHVSEVNSPAQALAELRQMPRGSVKLVMTELQFPDADGMAFVRSLRSDPALKGLPVMVVTPQPARELVIELVSIGVSTIVTKPFGGEMLLRRVTETLADATLLAQGEGAMLSWTVEDYLRRELKRAERNGSHFSLLIVTVDESMNGQAVPLLMRGLVRHMRETDVLVRLGDNQVVILLPDTDAIGASVVENRVWQTARQMMGEQTGGVTLAVGMRIGTATYPTEAGDGEALIAVARERATPTP
jgi:two-component system chemotaxis response regulator CheY